MKKPNLRHTNARIVAEANIPDNIASHQRREREEGGAEEVA